MPLKVGAVLFKTADNDPQLNAAISDYFDDYEIDNTYARLWLEERGEDNYDIIRDYVEGCGFTDKDIIILSNTWVVAEGLLNDEQNAPINVRPGAAQVIPPLPIPPQAFQAWENALIDNMVREFKPVRPADDNQAAW